MSKIVVFPGPTGASIHYRPDLLSAKERERGIELDELPVPEKREGQYPILMGDKATGQVWHEYRDIPPEPLEQRLDGLEKRIVALGG